MTSAKDQTARSLVQLGVRYAPLVYQALGQPDQGPAPQAPAAPTRKRSRVGARRRAMEHAYHLIEGSVLTVFDGDQRIYVVYNGDVPVASHPATPKPLVQLVQGYDLAKRVRPGQARGRMTPRVLVAALRPGPGRGWPR